MKKQMFRNIIKQWVINSSKQNDGEYDEGYQLQANKAQMSEFA